MDIEYVLKIDGYIVPNVVSCSPAKSDLDSDKTKRNAAGGLVRYRIARIPDLEVGIGVTTQEELQQLLIKTSAARCTVEWFDPELGDYLTGDFYAAGIKPVIRSLKPLVYDPFSFTLTAYKGV